MYSWEIEYWLYPLPPPPPTSAKNLSAMVGMPHARQICHYGISTPPDCIRWENPEAGVTRLSINSAQTVTYLCMRLYLCVTVVYSKIRHKGPTNTKSIRTSVVVILIITYYCRSMEDIAPLVLGNYWYEYECWCYTSLSLNYCSSQTFNLFISCTIMTLLMLIQFQSSHHSH